jgi:hypothetical protein
MERRIIKEKVIALRKKGKMYSEILDVLGASVSKSTLSGWCKNVPLPLGFEKRIKEYNKFHLIKARKIALEKKKIKREKYLDEIKKRNLHLFKLLENKDIAKIALAMLYIGEGRKAGKNSIMFGNSNPFIINLFLDLLRFCYKLDEKKFRCTLQCRADQDIIKLEKFWSSITKIPLSQFYKAQIDKRTIGKKSKKPDYKGVCRIDYFNAEIFLELIQISEIIYNR